MGILTCIIPGHPAINEFQADPSGSRWGAVVQPPFIASSFTCCLNSPLPDGQGVGLFLAPADSQDFEYLGYLTNQKVSDNFQIPIHLLGDPQRPLQVGLSLQDCDGLKNLEEGNKANIQKGLCRKVAMAHKLGENLFNFLQSHSRDDIQVMTRNGQGVASVDDCLVVPSTFLDAWMKKIETRILNDQTFLKDI